MLYSSMLPTLFSHVPPCFYLGMIIDTKEIRDTVVFDASIFGAKNQYRKGAKFSIYISLFG
jgi:hypothetical protein